MKKIYDSIVIGGGPAGMTAAMYLTRAGYKVMLIAGYEPGGNLAKIAKIDNYPGFITISGNELANRMLEQMNSFSNKPDTLYEEALGVDWTEGVYQVVTDGNDAYFSKTVVSAIGGSHRTLGLEDEDEWFDNGISFCATCDGPLYEGKEVVVIGGGNTALDYAIELSNYCKKVYVVHRRDEFRATHDMIEAAKSKDNIEFIMNSQVEKIISDEDHQLVGVKLRRLDVEAKLKIDGMFYALGFDKKKLDVKAKCNDSYFEAGDCSDEKFQQVVIACGDGCKAAMSCIEFLKKDR